MKPTWLPHSPLGFSYPRLWHLLSWDCVKCYMRCNNNEQAICSLWMLRIWWEFLFWFMPRRLEQAEEFIKGYILRSPSNDHVKWSRIWQFGLVWEVEMRAVNNRTNVFPSHSWGCRVQGLRFRRPLECFVKGSIWMCDFFLHQETNKAFTSDCLASAKVD
jgi:hypothetical protein